MQYVMGYGTTVVKYFWDFFDEFFINYYAEIRIRSNVLKDDDRKIRHFDLMPKVVGEFVDDHGLHELRLALTRGVWRAKDQHPIQVPLT